MIGFRRAFTSATNRQLAVIQRSAATKDLSSLATAPQLPPRNLLHSAHAAKINQMPSPPRERKRARELAAEFLAKGNPTGWFEALYQEAESGITTVPWADLAPNPHLLDFWQAHPQLSAHKTAVVVGCGLGDDAEQLIQWGFQTTAFDISETAIRRARQRFPNPKSPTSPRTFSPRRPNGPKNSISFSKPTRCKPCRNRFARKPRRTSPPSSPPMATCSSSPAPVTPANPPARCPGHSPARNSPHSLAPALRNYLSRTTSTIAKLRQLAGFVPSTNAVKLPTSRTKWIPTAVNS